MLSVDTRFASKNLTILIFMFFYCTIKIIIDLIASMVFLQWYVQRYAERQQICAASVSTQPERVTLVPFPERSNWATPPDADAAEHTALAGRCGFGKVLWQPVSRPTLCSVPHNYTPLPTKILNDSRVVELVFSGNQKYFFSSPPSNRVFRGKLMYMYINI